MRTIPALAIAALLAGTTVSNASSRKYHTPEKFCSVHAEYAYATAKVRDKGVPLDVTAAHLNTEIVKHQHDGTPHTALLEYADLYIIAREVYHFKNWTPERWYDDEYDSCTQGVLP
jgi:hypothetical protein